MTFFPVNLRGGGSGFHKENLRRPLGFPYEIRSPLLRLPQFKNVDGKPWLRNCKS